MLKRDEKIDVIEILKDLENYRPARRGWHWREPVDNLKMGPFEFHEMSEPLTNSYGLPSSKYFNDIDPQSRAIITTEIASGRFEMILEE
jgi:D-ornithine 4,5-aminomutase subunit beta